MKQEKKTTRGKPGTRQNNVNSDRNASQRTSTIRLQREREKKVGRKQDMKKKMINYETNTQVAPNPVTRWQWFSLQLLLETKASSGD